MRAYNGAVGVEGQAKCGALFRLFSPQSKDEEMGGQRRG
jgi:hypothetical protein